MKIPMRSILITFVVAFFVVALFLGASPPAMQNLPEGYRGGRVLGVSEAVANRSFDSLGYKLPENNFRAIIPPERVQDFIPISLIDSIGASIDGRTNAILYTQGGDDVSPIASITKLVTAMVFLDTKPDWNEYYRVRAEDRIDGGRIYLLTGEEVTKKDLFYLSLVGSANSATQALVHSTGMTEAEFVEKMNQKMDDLSLTHTHFTDPIGLSRYNVSTPIEVAKMANIALNNKYIQEATLTKNYEFITLTGRQKKVETTDILLDIFPENGIKIMGGKTGYIPEAGYCFVGRFVNSDGNVIVSAVLSGPSINSRFREARKLTNWVYDSFVWQNY